MLEMGLTEWSVLLSLMFALGAGAGFLAGLLGIGGGIVLVPGLYYLFKHLGFDGDVLMHMSVGTSLAVIIPTGFISARAHIKKGAVRIDLVKRIGAGIIIGVGAGTLIADYISGDSLKLVFACTLILFAGLMQIDPQKFRLRNDVPSRPWTELAGVIVGTLSTLMGVGGATLNVPFLTLHGVPIHTAVGTSSAIGPLIAIPGAIGFIVIGWNQSGLPPLSLGYVNLLAMLAIVPFSMLAAPWGVRAAHGVSVVTLRQIFSAFIVIVAARMLYSALAE